MSWRLAKSLETLRAQVNARWPKRSKSSDGTIGDAAHSARRSDHNPNAAGVVCALDITHDPTHGPNARKLAEALVASRDPRIKYLISNAQMCLSYPANGYPSWTWRPYSGNAHRQHMHISVQPERARYDSTLAWNLDALPGAPVHDLQPTAQRGVVTATALNLRNGPELTEPILSVLTKGTKLAVTGTSPADKPKWLQVVVAGNGKQGWVSAQYVDVKA
jgi:uncharacterized protein YgiM (DUF1202 family)